MFPFRYAVSLRVMHPDIDPKDITENIQVEPERSWRVGEPRSTPKGEKLKGIYPETYWTASLHKEKSLRSGKTPIEDFLAQQLQLLREAKTFLRTLRKTGGRTEFFIGLFSERNIGVELPSSLLRSMAELCIDLSLDIYSYPEKGPHNELMQPTRKNAGLSSALPRSGG